VHLIYFCAPISPPAASQIAPNVAASRPMDKMSKQNKALDRQTSAFADTEMPRGRKKALAGAPGDEKRNVVESGQSVHFLCCDRRINLS
jgi:hypothetical protein